MYFGDKPVLSLVEGGSGIVAEGTPEEVAKEPWSYTGGYLKGLFEGERAALNELMLDEAAAR
jgi:hypothetical protein